MDVSKPNVILHINQEKIVNCDYFWLLVCTGFVISVETLLDNSYQNINIRFQKGKD